MSIIETLYIIRYSSAGVSCLTYHKVSINTPSSCKRVHSLVDTILNDYFFIYYVVRYMGIYCVV